MPTRKAVTEHALHYRFRHGLFFQAFHNRLYAEMYHREVEQAKEVVA